MGVCVSKKRRFIFFFFVTFRFWFVEVPAVWLECCVNRFVYCVLPVFVLAGWGWSEYSRVWFSGELQSFSCLAQWILSNARIITEVLWMNFSYHERVTWSTISHYMPFGCVQLHRLFEPNYLQWEWIKTILAITGYLCHVSGKYFNRKRFLFWAFIPRLLFWTRFVTMRFHVQK